jgi:hypothetical protein
MPNPIESIRISSRSGKVAAELDLPTCPVFSCSILIKPSTAPLEYLKETSPYCSQPNNPRALFRVARPEIKRESKRDQLANDGANGLRAALGKPSLACLDRRTQFKGGIRDENLELVLALIAAADGDITRLNRLRQSRGERIQAPRYLPQFSLGFLLIVTFRSVPQWQTRRSRK